jgi:hypothetical protein
VRTSTTPGGTTHLANARLAGMSVLCERTRSRLRIEATRTGVPLPSLKRALLIGRVWGECRSRAGGNSRSMKHAFDLYHQDAVSEAAGALVACRVESAGLCDQVWIDP